jgi:hypothetical protein
MRASEALEGHEGGPLADDTAWLDEVEMWNVYVEVDGSLSTIFRISLAQSRAEVVTELADKLQEEIIDHTHEARPQCPSHAHPLRAIPVGDGRWSCPDGGWSCAIGQYAAAVLGPQGHDR